MTAGTLIDEPYAQVAHGSAEPARRQPFAAGALWEAWVRVAKARGATAEALVRCTIEGSCADPPLVRKVPGQGVIYPGARPVGDGGVGAAADGGSCAIGPRSDTAGAWLGPLSLLWRRRVIPRRRT